MPTATKLIAAALFAAIGWLAAQAYIAALPPSTPVGWLRESAAFAGLLCGWLIFGRSSGRGYGVAMGNGISTAVAVAFWVLLFWSIYEMVVKSTKMLYDGPMEAVLGMFDLMVKYARLMLSPEVLGIMLVGGVLAGLMAEWAGRRWS